MQLPFTGFFRKHQTFKKSLLHSHRIAGFLKFVKLFSILIRKKVYIVNTHTDNHHNNIELIIFCPKMCL